jgi:HPt (histidine-containing phosphotransfer) domain-containing protein
MQAEDPCYPFNQAVFISNFERMEEIIPPTVASFTSVWPDLLARIEVAIASGDPGALQIAAHTLKGVVSNFYAEPVRLLAWELEKLGKAKSLEGAEPLFGRLLPELSILTTALNQLAKKHQLL